MNGRRGRQSFAALVSLTALVSLLMLGRAAWPASAEYGGVGLAVAFGGRMFDTPVELVAYPRGRVLLLRPDGGTTTTVLDIGDRLATGHDELGLLSVAIDPAFATNGHLWVYYTAPAPLRGVVSRFTVSPAHRAEPASELVVLEVPQPFENHNGGALRFGPDGLLYISLGDGGDAGDPLGTGQDTGDLLGSVLRIDVRGASAAQPYVIPPGNPFAGHTGARPEVWAYGFRNPWRMAFDPVDGRLWLGDVGQESVEEVNVIVRGGNYGWSTVEGHDCYRPGCDGAGTAGPLADYTHERGCSITGGVVYRGASAPSLVGRYLFADLCTRQISALGPEHEMMPVAVADSPVISFGTDGAGEVYVLQMGGPILRLVGAGAR